MSNSPREPSKIVEDICWRFECAWKDATCPKQRPRVEDFLREAPEAKRDQLLVELVGLDVDYRRAQGEVPQTQEYRERFPSIDRAWLDRLLPTAATIASDAPRPNPNVRSDHNLLLGILAYQNAFITREALFAAMQAWLYDKAKSLADILQNQGALDGEERVLLEALVRRHLKQNDDDPQKSLQAVNSISSVRDELEQLPDPALQASIAHLSKGRPDDDATATRSYSAGESTSQGTRFRILRPHAKGGLGQVSVALDSELNREVALKEIQSRYADNPDSRSRFLLEAEITGGLEHPGIVPVYGLGTYADGRPFYAMRFIKGDSLMDAIGKFHGGFHLPSGAAAGTSPARQAGPNFNSMEFKQFMRRLTDVCNAMQYAHDRGVLHRDIKPGNIMLGKYGETLVVDWGLAKARGKFGEPEVLATGAEEPTLRPASGNSSAETVAGSAMGTPAFMSPEQAEGRLDLLGPASDVYSLGATLYCLLTGKAPVAGNDVAEVLSKVQRGEFFSPRQIEPAISPPLEAICLKAMALKPADRYASPRQLAEDIEHWLADEPVRAWPEPWTVKARRWVGHHRTLVTASAATILVAVVGLTIATALLSAANEAERIATKKAQDAQIQAEADRRQAEGDRKQAVRAEKAQTEQLWKSYRDQAEARRFSRQPGQRFESIKALAEAARIARSLNLGEDVLQDLRRKAIACLALPDLRFREWDGWPAGSVGLDYNGERDLYARTDEQGNVSVRRLDDDTEVARLAGKGTPCRPYFSGDGLMLVLHETASPHRLSSWRPGEPAPFATLGEVSDVGVLEVNPDGSYVALAGKDGVVLIVETSSGRRTFLPRGAEVARMQFSTDNRWLIADRRDGSVQVRDLGAGRDRLLRSGELDHYSFAIQPGGRLLALNGGPYPSQERSEVRLFDLETGVLAGVLQQADMVESVAWHPDGKTLAVGTLDASLLCIWDVPTRKLIHTLDGHKGGALRVNFNQTGDLLMSHSDWDGGIRLWHPRTGKQLLVSPERLLGMPKESRDGRLLALATLGGKLRMSEACPSIAYRTLVRDPTKGPAGFLNLAVHPEGRLLAAGQEDGVCLWDVESGYEVEFLRLGLTHGVSFDGTGALWTWSFNANGLRRWPVRPEAAAHHLSVGSPQVFPLPGWRGGVSASADGRLVACTADINRGTALIHLDWPDAPVWLSPQYDVRGVSVSSNGELVATGSHSNDSRTPKTAVKIWESRSGRLVKELSVPPQAYPYFSPDGRWLAVDSGEIYLWQVENWRECQRIHGHAPTFTPDSKLLAVETGKGVLELIDLSNNRTVVRLEDPSQARAGFIRFSPDGNLLITASNDDQAIHVWDLRAVRKELACLGLDWHQVPFPSVPPQPARAPLVVRVLAAGLLDVQTSAKRQRDQAILNLCANPFDADAHLRLGTMLVEAGQVEPGQKQLMVALALRPDLTAAHSERVLEALRRCGAAYVSQKRWKEAAVDFVQLTKLERSPHTCMHAAALLLADEDRPGYRRMCKLMMERYHNTTDPLAAEATAKTCLITEEALDDDGQLAKLAEIAVQQGQAEWALPYFQFTRGLAEYRHGRHASALEWFGRSRKTYGQNKDSYKNGYAAVLNALNGIFESMALHKLGRTEEADRLVAHMAPVVNKALTWRNGTGDTWHDWLLCEVALKEAEALLKNGRR